MNDPFDDMADLNPFSDPSVVAASLNSKKQVPKLEMDTELRQAPQITRKDNQGSGFLASNQFDNQAGISAELREVERRKAELDRRDREIAMREAQLAAQSGSMHKPPNFPPFPSWLPFGPCFYIDIEDEIPPQHVSLCQKAYINLIAYCVMLMLNMLGTACGLFGGLDNATVSFILSIIACAAICPFSFVFTFRSCYVALKSNSSFYFFLYFISAGVEAIFHIAQLIGATGAGWAGFMTGANLIDKSHPIAGVFVILLGFGYTALLCHTIYVMRLVHMVYKLSGANLAQAQSEFSAGVWKHGGAQIVKGAVASSMPNVP